MINNKNTFYVSGDNNTIKNIQIGDMHDSGETSTTSMKRKFEDNTEEKKDNNNSSQTVVPDAQKGESIFTKWSKFLEKKENFHPYSPEYHRVIRSGKMVSPRPSLDQELYEQHVNQHEEKKCPLPEVCTTYIGNVMDQNSLKGYEKAIRKIPDTKNGKDENIFLFFEKLFRAMYDFHTTYKDIYDGEITFNCLFLFPFLKAVAKAVSEEVSKTKTDFCEGEVCLDAMTTQVQNLNMITDDRNRYKADGVNRMYGYKKLEILVLETSSHFGSTDQTKSKFDHHKGLFGTLAMLKTIAGEYQYGSLATFKQIKVIFVHATDKTVYLWSMSLSPEDDVYDLWLEDTLLIKPDLDDKLESVPSFLQFYWKMKDLLKETSEMVMKLKREHDSTLIKNRFRSLDNISSLSITVNPSILRLIEEEDKAGMSHLGPIFVPK